MFASSWVTRGKVALEGTETEKQFAHVLFDENVQVLTSFQLNQIASLTYGDEVCDQIFEILDTVMANPVSHSVLTLQKSLVIAKHCLVYGSEKCVNSVWGLGRHVDHLQEFNTVLIAQERGTPDAWWQRVKGGGVDKGLPVREAAKELLALIQSKEQIQLLRHTNADPNSLVPVGDNRAAFVSDEVRHYMLKKRMDEELGRRTKSNLAKAEGGFGGGYQAKDGKAVVGAAHGVEEMLAAAKREKKKYTDEGPPPGYNPPERDLFSGKTPAPTDLLDFGEAPQTGPATDTPELDLLDMSAAVETTTQNTGVGIGAEDFSSNPLSDDLLGMPTSNPVASSAPTNDLLGMPPASSLLEPTSSGPSELLNMMAVAPPTSEEGSGKATSGGNENMVSGPPGENTLAAMNMKKPIMGSTIDRFAALDDLARIGGPTTAPGASAEDAMKRIMGEVDVKTPAPAPSMLPPNGSLTSTNSTMPPPPSMAPPLIAPDSSLRFGATFGDSTLGSDGEDDGFVMGGVIGSGSGLQPTAPPPPVPPPPPPS